MSAKDELPSTLNRSPKKAQETWSKTHDCAVDSYGEGERAHRTAFASLKHSIEKVGDDWEPEDSMSPSDAQTRGSRATPAADRRGRRRQRAQAHLMELAKRLDVKGRSRIELVEAPTKANRRETSSATADRAGRPVLAAAPRLRRTLVRPWTAR